MNISWEVIWAALASAGLGVSSLWAWIQKQRRDMSETRATVAEDERDREMATSAQTLYSMMNERLKIVEEELRSQRMYTRRLEIHIGKLERLLRTQGLDVPEIE
jgi:uncharacterized protein HemX